MAENSRLIDLLVEWEERRREGQEVSAEELAANTPDLLPDLKRRIADLMKAESLLEVGSTVRGGVTAPHSPPPPNVPGYEILGELGRGGMGVVYKARQLGLNRLVALKMILAGAHAIAEELTRFRIEAEAVARLQHPNIVQVHEIGEWQASESSPPMPFFSLEYVEGGSLAQRLNGTPLPPNEGAQLVETLAQAVHAAHLRGVVHRDLKPANILLQKTFTEGNEENEGSPKDPTKKPPSPSPSLPSFPSVPSSVPKITDFGLAKRLDVATDQTKTGSVMGTPSYMAPEQALGRTQDIGPLTDVYALGTILYECLTGRPPFKGATVLDTLEQVRSVEPVPPLRLQPKVPRDLETICLKCLEKEPHRRYGNAQELGQDLRRFQASEPIVARPTPWWERGSKWARRRPAIAFLLGLVLAVTVLGFSGVTWQWVRAELALTATELARQEEEKQKVEAENARKKEEAAKNDARRALDEALVSLYFQKVATADRAWWAKDVASADRTLNECEPQTLRGWEWNYLKRQCHADLFTFRGHQTAVTCVAYSPDGERLISGSLGGPPLVWEASTGKIVFSLRGHKQGTSSVAWSSDGLLLATGDNGGTVKVWNATTGLEMRTLEGHTNIVVGLAFSPDCQRLVSGSQDGSVRMWDLTTGQQAFRARAHLPTVSAAAYSPDGQLFASAGGKGSVRIWSTGAGMEVFTLQHTGAALSVAFSPDGKQIAFGSSDHTIRIWNTATGQPTHLLRGHSDWVKGLAYSPDGKLLASASYDQTVMVWDTATGRELFTLRGHQREVNSVAFEPGGQHLASASRDGTVKLWKAAAQEARTLQGHKFTIFGLAVSPDGQRIASASGDKTIKLWNAATGDVAVPIPENAAVFSVAYSPDRRHFAAACNDGILRIRDAATGKEVHTLKGHTGRVRSVAYSPDGDRLVSGGENDNTVIVWDTRSGEEIFTLRGNQKSVVSVAFSPDGWRVASGSRDGTVQMWDAAAGRELYVLPKLDSMVMSVVFNPDGKSFASCSTQLLSGGGATGVIRIWDTETGKEIRVLHGHSQLIYGIAYSPDGQRLASVSADRTIRIWNSASGRHILTLRGHAQDVVSVTWSPDGHYLVTGGSEGPIKIWDGRPWTENPPTKE